MSTGAAGGVVISPSPSPSCLSAASSIDNLTTPLSDITVSGATGTADGASASDRKEGESENKMLLFFNHVAASENPPDISVSLQLCLT